MTGGQSSQVQRKQYGCWQRKRGRRAWWLQGCRKEKLNLYFWAMHDSRFDPRRFAPVARSGLEGLEIRRVCIGVASPNTSVARTSKCCFHSVICVGWTLNCSANSASVLSPLMAAKASCVLNMAPWFCLGLFIALLLWIVTNWWLRRSQAPTYHTIRITGTFSLSKLQEPSHSSNTLSMNR